MKKLIWIPLLGLLLFTTGCAGKIAAGLGIAENEIADMIANVKKMNDLTAGALKQAPCAMDVGAYHRMLSPDEQRAVDVLCGGSGEKPVTVEDVRRARDLMNLVQPP